jgi:hypothetical protein
MALSKTSSSNSLQRLPGKVRDSDVTPDPSILWGDWPGGFLAPSALDPSQADSEGGMEPTATPR